MGESKPPHRDAPPLPASTARSAAPRDSVPSTAVEALTADVLATWHTPKEVVDLLPAHWDDRLKRTEIATRMQAGKIRAAALSVNVEGQAERTCLLLSRDTWANWSFLAHDGSAEPFWEGASFQKYVAADRVYGREKRIQVFGVRLNPEDISTMFFELGVQVSANSRPGMLAAALLAYTPRPVGPIDQIAPELSAYKTAPPGEGAPPNSSNHKRRGPKPKSFWGEAMAAVEASISTGELLASTQADIERAMADWIIAQGYDAGESTIRNYAKPVWERRSR